MYGWRKLRAQFIADNSYAPADAAGKAFDAIVPRPTGATGSGEEQSS
jgi:hypothetical protein